MAAKNASRFLKTLLLTFLTRPTVHGVPNAADTVESKECDPIDLKTDYPEYRLSPLSLNRYGRSTPQVFTLPCAWCAKCSRHR